MTPRAWNDGLLFGDYEGYTLDSDIEVCYWAAPENCASVADFVANGNKVINYSDVYMYYVGGGKLMQYQKVIVFIMNGILVNSLTYPEQHKLLKNLIQNM